MSGRRIVIATGGTAGHVRPALAFASAYRRLCADLEVVFVGAAIGFERQLVEAQGYRLELAPALPLARTRWRERPLAVSAMVRAIPQARRLLRAARAEIAIGFGGYASLPPLLAARSLGLRTVTFECNLRLGLANRLLGRVVDCVAFGLAEAPHDRRGRRKISVGMPMDPTLVERAADAVADASSRSLLLVTGGSEGSPFLNRAAPDLVQRLLARGFAGRVLHQAGPGCADEVQRRYSALGIEAEVQPFIADMPAAYAAARFAVSGAGASTLAELAAFRLPALIVPLSNAAWDHQVANAVELARRTGVPWTRENEWQADGLADQIIALWNDGPQRQRLRDSIGRFTRPDAAQRLAQLCEELITRG